MQGHQEHIETNFFFFLKNSKNSKNSENSKNPKSARKVLKQRMCVPHLSGTPRKCSKRENPPFYQTKRAFLNFFQKENE
jgi:hypothetical protein